ncbi:MAG: metallopeptidase family protein [Propionibacteriaceae bacterium]|jgi:predicted Zn-dependent protease with MMP-like domain|nr:metallopeptidase family protein [Propionibacteriaceae bacterium]
MWVDDKRFDELVEAAIAEIPAEFLDKIDNCVIVVEDEPDGDDPELLGYYDGIPPSERWNYSGVLPDRIVIFKGPTLRMVRSEEELVEEVRITVWHEIAHYFGIDDDELDDLGYA